MAIKKRPCGRCGRLPMTVRSEDDDGARYRLVCVHCEIRTPDAPTLKGAILLWNSAAKKVEKMFGGEKDVH